MKLTIEEARFLEYMLGEYLLGELNELVAHKAAEGIIEHITRDDWNVCESIREELQHFIETGKRSSETCCVTERNL